MFEMQDSGQCGDVKGQLYLGFDLKIGSNLKSEPMFTWQMLGS